MRRFYNPTRLSRRAEIEEFLGRKIPESAAGSIRSLYEVSPELVHELRRLHAAFGAPFHLALLGHLMGERETMDDIWNFCKEVVEEGTPVFEWRKQFAFCHLKFDETGSLEADRESLLAPLANIEGLRWFRDSKAKHSPSLAPGIVIPEVDFYWTPPPGTSGWRPSSDGGLEQIQDLSVAIRRWLASEIAKHELNVDASVLNLSDDARRALEGLEREREWRANSEEDRGLLGSGGDDEFYR